MLQASKLTQDTNPGNKIWVTKIFDFGNIWTATSESNHCRSNQLSYQASWEQIVEI